MLRQYHLITDNNGDGDDDAGSNGGRRTNSWAGSRSSHSTAGNKNGTDSTHTGNIPRNSPVRSQC